MTDQTREDNTEPISPSAAKTEPSPHSPLSVDLGIPEQVEVGETFPIHATLENTSDQALEMTTGDPVFYYVVRDSKGKAINTNVRTSVGVARTIDQKEVIAEKHPYKFKTPGTYDISVVAEIILSDKDHSNHTYQLESEPKKIEVLE